MEITMVVTCYSEQRYTVVHGNEYGDIHATDVLDGIVDYVVIATLPFSNTTED